MEDYKISMNLYIGQHFSESEVEQLVKMLELWANNNDLQLHNLLTKKGSIEIAADLKIILPIASAVVLFILKVVVGEWIKDKYKQFQNKNSNEINNTKNIVEQLKTLKDNDVLTTKTEMQNANFPIDKILENFPVKEGTSIIFEIKVEEKDSSLHIRAEKNANERKLFVNIVDKNN